jgi:UTP:GlnB (protein PII) uridylyltransferase
MEKRAGMNKIFRTWDTALRERRRSTLIQAAEAAHAAAVDSSFDLLVTGSLARGQVHPWSDLDLILRAKGSGMKKDWA